MHGSLKAHTKRHQECIGFLYLNNITVLLKSFVDTTFKLGRNDI
jgi:hypothetical protein